MSLPVSIRILSFLALAAPLPVQANAMARLLDMELSALSQGEQATEPSSGSQEAEPGTKPADLSIDPKSSGAAGSLDFDLLGAPPPVAPVDQNRLRLRRTMLTLHQGFGLGLVGLQLATTVVGQLSYSDRFANGPSTGKYEQSHAILAYATLGTFAANGVLALLAPKPIQASEGFDRVTLHKISMFTAAAGMVAQGVLGVYTREREGYLNQQSFATAHLVIGYVTMAAVAAGVGVLVF
jgi:hypothetical protein